MCPIYFSALLKPRYTAHFRMQRKVKSPFFLLRLAMLSNLHVPKAHFNLLSSWFTLRDCLHLPPRHASLPLIISHEQCIICVSSKRRLLQQGNILFWPATRFTNTPPVQCLIAPMSGNSLNREIIILDIWVSVDLTPAE